ncbi:DUF3343 domain-containing protein [Caloranaerobacter azorensis]|uniref:DUF3343 domain-containing protein n=1 Tax=Caloranaerobacter azorensis TaxID=116090 RepID=A0A6P1YGR5_9FIRM|nr:DUF3343 domain-containing protein [Caloranaerobacter azorensis]
MITKRKYFKNDKYYIAVFDTKNNAIQLYYILEKKGINKFQLISTPCQLSFGCSYSIKFNNIEDFEILNREAVKYKKHICKVYRVERINGKKQIKQVKGII